MKYLNKKNISLTLCFFTISFYIIFGNCLTFNIGNRMPIKVAEIFGMITSFIILCLYKKKVLIIKKTNIKFFIWFLIATFSIIIFDYSIKEKLYGMLYSFRIIVTILITIIIANVFSIYNISNKYLYKYIIINYVVVSLFGIIQLITYPSAMDFYNIFYKIGVYFPNPDPHNGRLISTYFDPNFLAACLIIPLTLILNQYIKNGNLKNLIGIVFFISIIILTVSRSGVLGICLILIINFILSIKFNDRKIDLKDAKMIRAFIIMITIGSFFIILTMFSNIPVFKRILNTKEDDSTYARVNSWSKGIEIINNGYGSENDSKIEKKEEKNDGIIDSSKDKNGKNHSRGNIFIGTGYNMLGFMESNQDKPKSISFGNDSSIMVILISSGIIGMIYFIYIIISTIYKLWKEKEESIFNEVIIEIIISSLIICNFNNLLFYTLWIFPVFLLLNINEINYIEK